MVFRLETGFEVPRRAVFLCQKLLDARERPPRSNSAGFDRFFGTVEIVPSQRLHIGAKNEVGVAFPNFELMLLRGADGAADHLEDVGRRAAMTVLHPDGDADDRSGAHFAGGARRNRSDQTTVGKAARTDLYRFEQAGKRTARADGIDEMAMSKNDWLARSEVRGNHRQRNAKIFELARFENSFDQAAKALVAGEAEARNTPAGDVAKAKRAARRNDSRERRATRVSGAENAAHTGSRDMRDGDFVLLEDLQNTEMCEAAREASPESEADTWPSGRGCWTFVQPVAVRITVARHERRMTAPSFSTNGPRVIQ